MYHLEFLNSIEQDIIEEALPEPLPVDRWFALSIWQKSVRRNHTLTAKRAALTLLQQDARRFFDRLAIVVCEDVGVGSPDTVAKVLFAVASPKWRRTVGDVQVGLHLTGLLCEAVKSRLADALFIQAERTPSYNTLRLRMAASSDETLAAFIGDEKNSLVGRAIAAWLLAGTQRFYSEAMPARRGSPDKAILAIQSLPPSTLLTQACSMNIKSSRWPLSLHLPLIAQEAMKYPTCIQHNAVPAESETMISGLDIFTRSGRLCYRQLREVVPGLKPFTIQQLGLGIFYLDGGKVDKELTSPELEAIQRAGELTDLESAGLSEPEYMHLRRLLTQHMDTLTCIRQEHLNAIQGIPTFTLSGDNGGAV